MKNKGKKKKESVQNVDDPRFVQMVNDPRFKTMRSQEKKVKIDDRFKGMFTEKRFTAGNRVDKRGNLITKPESENLEQHYELEKDNEKDDNLDNIKLKIPDARGLDSDVESSSSDEESEDEEEESIEHDWGELDKDAPRTEEETRRLAVCNIDWDRIRAVDLFVLFNSFKPDTGVIKNVNIYPSEFGKKRMEEEKLHGPTEIVETPILEDDGIKHEDGDAEQEYMTEKLRQYQLNRLKYYYAIVDCDSSKTAATLYEELDGFEYENSSSALDVRFVPDDMEFDDEPSSSCASHPDFATYKAPNFVTTALQQSKVQMTWDENDPTRQQKIAEAFNSKSEQALDDLQAFLASSEDEDSDSSDDEVSFNRKDEPVKDKVCKYKQLLKVLEEEEEGEGQEEPEMDISFPEEATDSSEDEDGQSFQTNDMEKDQEIEEMRQQTQSKRNKKKGDKRKDIPVEEENITKSDAGLELLLMDEEADGNKKHFDYTSLVQEKGGKKKKRKNKKNKTEKDDEPEEDNFNFDPDDPRFSKLFSSHLYNIDPSDPHFKKTEAMELLMNKKHKVSIDEPTLVDSTKSTQKVPKDKEVSSLVASIKRKTKRLKSSKND